MDGHGAFAQLGAFDPVLRRSNYCMHAFPRRTPTRGHSRAVTAGGLPFPSLGRDHLAASANPSTASSLKKSWIEGFRTALARTSNREGDRGGKANRKVTLPNRRADEKKAVSAAYCRLCLAVQLLGHRDVFNHNRHVQFSK